MERRLSGFMAKPDMAFFDTANAGPKLLAALRVLRARWLPVALTLFAVLLAAWWFFGRSLAVTTAQVTTGTAAEIVYATGAVEPVVWAKVTSMVRGQIVERCRCEGKAVKAGDSLARLDDTEAQASLRELKAREEFLRREFDRQNLLAAKGIASDQSLQKSESDLRQIQAQIAAQTERLVYFRIVAPIDGVVLREDGEVGEIVDPGFILYRVGNPSPLWLVAEVNEEDIPRVSIGQNVLLRTDAFAGRQLTGTVSQITPAGDPGAKTYRIRIGLPEDTPLRVGMSVEANVVTRKKDNVLLAPAAAIRANAVFVLRGRRAYRTPVEIGLRGTQAVEIVSGLKQGDIIISPLPAELRDGQIVRSAAQPNAAAK